MIYPSNSPEEYNDALPDDRKAIILKMREAIKSALPDGFIECINYGMLGYVVPHSLYSTGYHVDPNQPLPFMALASQKNFIALYHMGLYGDENLLNWFKTEWPKHTSKKLDMGKSCIRFKKPEDVPLELIAELSKKITVNQWIERYEAALEKK